MDSRAVSSGGSQKVVISSPVRPGRPDSQQAAGAVGDRARGSEEPLLLLLLLLLLPLPLLLLLPPPPPPPLLPPLPPLPPPPPVGGIMSRKGKSGVSSMNDEEALPFSSDEAKGDDLQEIKKELVKIEEKVDALLASLEQMESDPSEQCDPYVRNRPEEEMESNNAAQEADANMEMEESGGADGADGNHA
ncbi:heterogeneous nuclear ribonucleoproteins C1/C2-like isoform X2 [Dromiciops gliroides]|uniref:heterogeneous nuclear ribonucleoproteins C1/C2-like isoform X2 n=1 Tax=Dromiciops gliroides TaxID=33562 RepID=UPI001CC5BC3E|nr:heterogeneous nuclear ribonucleoproteins C1/C2-like isoform X2 [Dromiciops gliroides]